MQTVPHVKVLSVECAELPYVLRMPFRFGATTVREGLQAVIRVRLGLPGKEKYSATPPKPWPPSGSTKAPR